MTDANFCWIASLGAGKLDAQVTPHRNLVMHVVLNRARRQVGLNLVQRHRIFYSK